MKPSANPPILDGCEQSLKPNRMILKFVNKNNNGEIQRVVLDCNKEGFENSHGSCWFRGPLLGKGGFASVFLAHINGDFSCSEPLLPGTLIAVKSSFLKHSSSLQIEKKVLHDLKFCSNVVRCYGDEVTSSASAPSNQRVYNLVLEYCDGGSLHDRITQFKPNARLPELEVRRYTRDIVSGIAWIHGNGYIHCDIKPENILLSSSVDNYGDCCLVAKIADFGLAMKMSNVVTIDEDDMRGTKPYMAPESLNDSYIDWPVDIWALGCVVLEMLIGKRVWWSKYSFNFDMLTHVSSGLLSPIAMDFVRRCLVKNPYKRSSACSLLHHPFISYNF